MKSRVVQFKSVLKILIGLFNKLIWWTKICILRVYNLPQRVALIFLGTVNLFENIFSFLKKLKHFGAEFVVDGNLNNFRNPIIIICHRK